MVNIRRPRAIPSLLVAASLVGELVRREREAGLRDVATCAGFGEKVKKTKRRRPEFLIAAKHAGKSVVGYGTPAGVTHCSTSAKVAPSSSVTPSTAAATSTASSRRVRISSAAAGADRRDAARLSADPALEPARGDRAANGIHPRWEAQFVVPIPEVGVYP